MMMNGNAKETFAEEELSHEEMKEVAGGECSIPNRASAYMSDSALLKDSSESAGRK